MAESTRRRRRKQETETPKEVEGKITVNSELWADGEIIDENEAEEIVVQRFESEPAYITVGAGLTKQPRKYESLRVDVRVSMPCYPEQLDQTFENIAEYVAVKLEDEMDKYLGEGGDGSDSD